jgi:hypothetical protein
MHGGTGLCSGFDKSQGLCLQTATKMHQKRAARYELTTHTLLTCMTAPVLSGAINQQLQTNQGGSQRLLPKVLHHFAAQFAQLLHVLVVTCNVRQLTLLFQTLTFQHVIHRGNRLKRQIILLLRLLERLTTHAHAQVRQLLYDWTPEGVHLLTICVSCKSFISL